jgi:hypothetical protein
VKKSISGFAVGGHRSSATPTLSTKPRQRQFIGVHPWFPPSFTSARRGNSLRLGVLALKNYSCIERRLDVRGRFADAPARCD